MVDNKPPAAPSAPMLAECGADVITIEPPDAAEVIGRAVAGADVFLTNMRNRGDCAPRLGRHTRQILAGLGLGGCARAPEVAQRRWSKRRASRSPPNCTSVTSTTRMAITLNITAVS